MPLFCANMILHFDIWNVLETILMIPLLKEHFMVVLLFLFKTLGVETFIKVKKIGSLVSPVRRGLNHHMAILTKDLEASGGPYICGDSYTLADVSMVPIFEASKPDMVMHSKLLRVGKLIDEWKREHTWFNDFYEN